MPNKILKGASLLTVSNIIVATCSFARNVVIARLISVEDYGIASLFAIVISVAETFSYIGIDRYLVQAKDGDHQAVQSTAQFFSAARGILSATIIVFCSSLFSKLFGLPDLAWAFGTLAIIPIARGFAHLDMVRLQRELTFSPLVWVDTVPQVVVLAMAAPLALWLDDYRVMLWIVSLQAILYTLVSHLVAQRPYRLKADAAAFRAIFDFGWPLLINAVLMFGTYQGHRIIIGITLSKTELAYFSAVFALLMTLFGLLTRVFSMTALPVLSNAREVPRTFDKNARLIIQFSFVLSLLFGVVLAIGGPSIFVAFFGEKYRPATFIFSWIALAFALRIVSSGLITVAISLAKTKIAMYANFVRSSALALSFGAVYLGYGLLGVAVSGLLGELFALTTTMQLLARCQALKFLTFALHFTILYAVFLLTIYIASSFADGSRFFLEPSLSIFVLMPALIIMLRASPEAYSVMMKQTHQLIRLITRSHD